MTGAAAFHSGGPIPSPLPFLILSFPSPWGWERSHDRKSIFGIFQAKEMSLVVATIMVLFWQPRCPSALKGRQYRHYLRGPLI